MKKTQLQLMIRKIVREEVAMAIQEVITELKQPTQQVSQPKSKKKIVEKKTYSTNPILNDVLNETADDDEWKTMGGGTYDSNRIGEVLSSAYSDTPNGGDNGNLAASMGVDPNNAPDFLKKDYRKLMKAVDEKSKQKRGVNV
tara:strand:+ start:4578 stop:5003 length:426 start_codon:yes stop_codon:yes gene_type:complete